jgi:hypothetical protein
MREALQRFAEEVHIYPHSGIVSRIPSGRGRRLRATAGAEVESVRKAAGRSPKRIRQLTPHHRCGHPAEDGLLTIGGTTPSMSIVCIKGYPRI